MALEVADHAMDGELVELAEELSGRRLERALGDVERDVAP